MSKSRRTGPSARERADGRWEVRQTVEGHRISGYGATAADALRDFESKRNRHVQGLPLTDARVPFRDVVEQWRVHSLPTLPLSPKTRRLYGDRARMHIANSSLGGVSLAALRAGHIERWVVQSRDGGAAASSIRTDYAVLTHIFRAAMRDGLIAASPLVGVPRPAKAGREVTYMRPEQVQALLAAVSHSRHAPAILLIAATGMRRGEGLALRWSDVNFERGTIRVAGTIDEKLVRQEWTKSKRNRVIPVGRGVLNLLRDVRRQQIVEQKVAGADWSNTMGLVFTTATGTAYGPRNVLRTVQNAATRLGLPETVGVHTLRHSAATALLEGGAHIKNVSSILGHSSAQVTLDFYAHVHDEQQRAALDSLTGTMWGQNPADPSSDPSSNGSGRDEPGDSGGLSLVSGA